MKTLPENQIKKLSFFAAIRLVSIILVFCLSSFKVFTQTTCGTLTIDAVVTSDYNGQDVSCADSSDGTICVNILAGTGPYTYQWVGGPTTQCYNGVDAGTYTVIVTDLGSGQVCFEDVIVNEPAPLTVFSFNITDPTCNTSCDGSGTAIVIGGTSPVNYLWGSGETGFTASNLCVGVNTLDVTDNNGCFFDTTFNINTPTAIFPNVVVNDVSCFGTCDGVAESFPTGGNGAPYQYSWVDDATSLEISTSAVANNLCTGSYTVTVTDPNLCSDDTTIFVDTPTEIIISVDNNSDATCSYICDGSTTVSIIGGTTPYTSVEWFQGTIGSGTATSFTGLTIDSMCHSTDYYVTVTDANGCVESLQVSQISSPPPINIGITSTDVDCNGNGNGSVVTTLTGGTAPLTPFWTIITPGGGLVPNNADQFTLDGGVYQLLVTDGNGCADSVQVTIDEPDTIISNGTVVDISCYDQVDGEITLNLIGGTTPYNITWTSSDPSFVDPGGNATSLSNLDSGSYTVSIIDDNGCLYDTTLIITKPSEIFANGSSTDVICFGDADGTITLNTSNGVPNYTWDWTGPSGFTSTDESLTGLDIGAYDVTITDNNGCTKDTSFTINEPPDINIGVTSTDVDCNGNGNGSVVTTLTGGTAPLTPFWTIITPGGGLVPNNADQFTLDGGVYQLLVTDGNGCADSVQVTIDEPDTIISNGTVVDISCYDQVDGEITLNLIGGSTPYNISWTSSDPSFVDPGGNATSLSNLDSGSYTVSIIDDNGCLYDTTLIITKPSEIFANGSSTDVICFGDADGTITLNTSNGVPNYTWDWTGPSGFTSTDESLTGLDIGAYDVTITDNNGCTKDTSFTINEPPDINIGITSTDVDCNGNGNGSVVTTLTGGTAPLTPFWTIITPGGGLVPNNADQFTLDGGVYQLLVTDGNGCADSVQVTIDEPDTIISNGTVVDISCYDQVDGEITLNLIGGTTPYNISWTSSDPSFVDPGGNATSLGNLDSGSYTVSIIDDNGCLYDTTLIITKPSEIFANGSSTDVICFGDADGTITLNTSNGVPNYTWDWTGPSGFTSTDESLTGLDIGAYDVTITDNNGCTKDTSFTINEPPDINIGVTSTDVDCNGNGNGSVVTTLTGGTAPLTPFWTIITPGGGLVPNNADQFTLDGGVYQLLVTDGNGCADSVQVTIDEPDTIISNGTVVDISCYDQVDGEITLNLIGGTTPYNISWTSSDPSFVDPGGNATSLSNLDSGSYTVSIIDDNGCLYDTTLIITKPSEIFANGSSTDVICFGDADGTITLNTSNGVPNYTWDWTGPSGFTSTDESLTGLDIGAYDVTITDNNGCTKDTSFTINEPDSIDIDGSHVDLTCFGANDGNITIAVSGGFAPTNWSWTSTNPSFTDPGGNATNLINLGPGVYTVTVTDDNSCTKDTSFVVLEPTEIFANGTITDLNCNANNSGEIDINPIGGSGVFIFDWDNDGTGDNDDTEDLLGLSEGTYCVSIIDQNQPNCFLDTCFTLTEPDELFANLISVTEISCADSLNGAIDIDPIGGTVAADYTYDWDNDGTGDNDDTQDLSAIGSGTYCVTVTDDNGCFVDTCIVITDLLPINYNPVIDTSSCGLENGNINLSVTGGNNPYIFDWDNDGTGDNDDTESLLGISEGVYQLTVIYTGNDGTTCSVDTSFNLIDNPPAVDADFVVVDESCFGTCDGSISTTINVGSSPITFNWTSSDPSFVNNGLASQFNLCSGDYFLTMTDANNCSLTDTFNITSAQELIVTETITNVDCSGDSTGAIAITVTGGNLTTSPDYTYSWTGINTGFTSNNQNLTNLVVDSYQIVVSDDDGCTDTSLFDVTENIALDLTVSATDASCGDSNGTVDVLASGGVVAADYTYSWSNSSGVIVGNTANINGLPADSYTVTVTDDLGCIDSATVAINDLSASTITVDTIVNESCAGDNDGLITVSITVSPPPGTLSWTGPPGFVDPGGVNTTISNLEAGQYIATLVDGLGCQQQEIIDIVAAQALSLNSVTNDPTCFGFNNGDIAIFPSGGSVAVDYQFDWDIDGTGDLDDNQDQTNLSSGTYIVAVYDDNGCTISDTFDLLNPSELIGSVSSSFAACGANDGYVTSNIIGGTIATDYSYSWIDQSTGLQIGNTDSIAQLPAGCYELTVLDDNGCVFTDITCISNPTGPSITLDQIDSVSCFGTDDGSIFITVSGGTGAYVYDWQTVNGFHCCNEDLVTFNAGTYSITITDSLGCISGETYTIPQPDSIEISGISTNLSCNSNSTGEIELLITGGTPAYSLSWNGPNGFTSNLQDLIGLDTGTYVVSGTDANGCTLPIESFDITQPDSINLTLSSTQTSCAAATGTANIVATGGTVSVDYTYYWIDNNNDTVSFTSNVDSLAAGTYYANVYDDNGCLGIDSVSVSQVRWSCNFFRYDH